MVDVAAWVAAVDAAMAKLARFLSEFEDDRSEAFWLNDKRDSSSRSSSSTVEIDDVAVVLEVVSVTVVSSAPMMNRPTI